MREDVLYASMSLLDGISIFMFAFGCFKISFKDYWKEILVTNILISIGTFFLRDSELMSNVVPILCFVALVGSLIFYFRITILGSIKLALYGFVAQIITQIIANAIFMISFSNSFSESLSLFGHWVQLIGDALLITITLILQKRRLWFTTMPHNYSFKLKLNKVNILSVLIAVAMVGFMYNIKNINNVYLGIAFWTICLINLMYIDIKKEKSGFND